MPLKAVTENLDDVDAGVRGFYKEVTVGDKKSYHLDIDGIDLLPPVRALKEENGARRIKEREALTKLSAYTTAFGEQKVEDILKILDSVPELEAKAAGGGDPKKLEGIVEARLAGKLAPLQRDLTKLQADIQAKDAAIAELTGRETTRLLHDGLREAIKKTPGFQEHAFEDAALLAERVFKREEDGSFTAKEGMGVTPGSDLSGWLAEMQPKRPHWWGPTQGGGARGGQGGAGGGVNPFARDTWNLTEQGRIAAADPKRAAALAAAAGVQLGATRPAAAR